MKRKAFWYSKPKAETGAGADDIDASALTITVDLSGGEGNDELRAGSADDLIAGDAGADELSGW